MAAAAAIAAGVIGAAGSVGGGIASQPEPVKEKTSYYNPFADPVLAGLSNEAMLGMGLASPMILEQAGPLAQVIQAIKMDPTMSDEKKRASAGALVQAFNGISGSRIAGTRQIGGVNFIPAGGELELALSDRQRKSIARGLREVGLGEINLRELFEKERAWQEQTSNLLGKQGELLPGILEGRLSTQGAIGNLMSELGHQFGGGSGVPGATAGGFMRNLERDINTTYDKQLEDVMRLANTTGFNPGRALSDLEDSRASALRNLGQQGALQANQILSMLQSNLQPAQNLAAQTAGIRSGQGVAASNVAGNQASAINQIQANTNAQRSQAIGAGIAGGANSLSNGILLNSLLSGGPAATQTTPTTPGPWATGYVFP